MNTTYPSPIIKEITLLSKEEAEKFLTKSDRAKYGCCWWTRSAMDNTLLTKKDRVKYHCYRSSHDSVWGINFDGEFREYTPFMTDYVIPALRITNLSELGLNKGDNVRIGRESWTVISPDLVLCDRNVGGLVPFRKKYTGREHNNYDRSYVKKWLEKWANVNIGLPIPAEHREEVQKIRLDQEPSTITFSPIHK